MRFVIACFLSAVLGCLCTVWLTERAGHNEAAAQVRSGRRGASFPLIQPEDRFRALRQPLFDKDGLSAEEAINVAVYQKSNRSVVNITTKGTRPDGFFLLDVPTEGSGSGSVIDKAGHILTNFHVVEDARAVEVALFDGKTYEARFVGADPINDVAVIKIDAPRDVLYPVTFGDSGNLRVGMRVYAIGNPFGLERTMTTGIISSLNRSLRIHRNRTIKSIIQIDAAVNPGNSGGPLLDAHGRQIGINTAIASKTGQSAGVGFAIPINIVTRVVPELIEHGRVIRPEIGIERVYETDEGLLVAKLTPQGPAENAGIRGPQVQRRRRGPFIIERIDRSAADLIVAVNDQKVETVDDFLDQIESKKPGERIELTVIRDGRRLKIAVTLSRPNRKGKSREPGAERQ